MINSPAYRWPWLMLPLRTVLFAAFQALFALGFLLAGSAAAWNASANWWPFAVTAANLVCIALLVRLYHREGKRYWDLFRFQRETVKSDLLALLGILIISGPIAFLPNFLAANWLFGDQQIALALFIRPLPAWAAYASLVIFPVTIALAELPTYFAYVMPRLAEHTGRPWLAVLLATFFLSAQHIALPLLPDFRFILWRLVMFFPFALMLGIVLRWRPRLLPYLVIIHGLMDLGTAAMLLGG